MADVSAFRAITGCASTEEAESYLAMSGSSLEMAISLYFDQGGAPVAQTAAEQTPPLWDSGEEVPEWYSLVWPKVESIPSAWLQGLVFDGIGLPQQKNGPCGVLAVVQAVIIAQNWNSPGFGPKFDVQAHHVTQALIAILSTGDKEAVELCSWKDKVGEAIKTISVPLSELERTLETCLPEYTACGGLILLLYSCVLTKGASEVRAEMSSEGAEAAATLVVGPFWVCSSELIGLMLRGKAGGNVGAFSSTGAKHNWSYPGLGVGMLSTAEVVGKIPVCDALKSPAAPVWLLHGGDHFTVLFGTDLSAIRGSGSGSSSNAADEGKVDAAEPPKDAKAAAVVEESGSCVLWHYNGLPPAGPRMARVSVTYTRIKSAAPPALKESYFKPAPGEIEEVIQADPKDKAVKPDDWTVWRYEVALAVSDPDDGVSGAERPAAMAPEPTFAQGEPGPGPWRCRKCYANRFRTMNFGMNDAGATHCPADHGKGAGADSRAECGWTLWMHYAELPPKIQRQVTVQFAPKIVTLLQSKWPGAKVAFDDGAADTKPPSV